MRDLNTKFLILATPETVNPLVDIYEFAVKENKKSGDKYSTYFLLINSLAYLRPEFFNIEKGPLDPEKVYPVRFYSLINKNTEFPYTYLFINYPDSYIHIPKTGGRFMINNYLNYQSGGNHLSANFNHANYNEYCEVFENCFTVVRNPFSWLVSYYHHQEEGLGEIGHGGCRKIDNNNTFEKFIFNICDLESDVDWFPYSMGETSQIFNKDNRVCASRIIYFERYEDGARCANLEKIPPNLKDIITSDNNRKFLKFRTSMLDYRRFFTQPMIDAVNEKFKFDLEFLGYDFEGLTHDKSFITIPNQMSRDEILKNKLYI